MDFTEKYIKMCKEAKEIQEQAKKFVETHSVLYFAKIVDKSFQGIFVYPYEIYLNDNDTAHYIWLPRQDQLQEMLKSPISQMMCLVEEIELETTDPFRKEYFIKFETLEQLWLAFVMEKKYYKRWDEEKEKWVLRNS